MEAPQLQDQLDQASATEPAPGDEEDRPPDSADAAPDARIGACIPHLLEEYGVLHLENALSTEGQRDLWRLSKPHISDPAGRATGFSNFCISASKMHKPKRNPEFDEYGSLMYKLASHRLQQAKSDDDVSSEPSYQHLLDLASGAVDLKLDECAGNYYREEAKLMNHTDGDNILFTMSVALGDDCEFAIGKATGRAFRISERAGKVRTIIMKSGDAVFFDGGTVPHMMPRIVPKTAPAWWKDEKVPNGSRCVVLFREKSEDFYKTRIKAGQALNR